MMDMGCVAYDVVYVIKSVWMSEHALHFVIRRGVWGLQGASPYGFGLLGGFFFFFFFYLSGQSRTVMMIIPLPHYGNNFATTNFGRKKCVGVPPPPPPPLECRCRLAQFSARHFARIVEVLLALLTWCGVVW